MLLKFQPLLSISIIYSTSTYLIKAYSIAICTDPDAVAVTQAPADHLGNNIASPGYNVPTTDVEPPNVYVIDSAVVHLPDDFVSAAPNADELLNT